MKLSGLPLSPERKNRKPDVEAAESNTRNPFDDSVPENSIRSKYLYGD